MTNIRRKCFLSYHHADQDEVDEFVRVFDEERDVFITRGLGITSDEDIINSDDTDYVMQRIREDYLGDSTVTIVLIGNCTWARRFVDWEIQASLRHGETVVPLGVMGICLPSYKKGTKIPNRLSINLRDKDSDKDSYARWYVYPNRKDTLASWIEDAFDARTSRENLIINPRDRFKYNKSC